MGVVPAPLPPQAYGPTMRVLAPGVGEVTLVATDGIVMVVVIAKQENDWRALVAEALAEARRSFDEAHQ